MFLIKSILVRGMITMKKKAGTGDSEPDAFLFSNISNAELLTAYKSFAKITGINERITIVAENAEIGIGSIDFEPSSWGSSVSVELDDYLYIRALSSSNFSTTSISRVWVNGIDIPFEITTRDPNLIPRDFYFDPIGNAVIDTSYIANALILDIDLPIVATVDRGEIGTSVNENPPTTWGQEISVSPNEYLFVKNWSSSNYSTISNSIVSIGGKLVPFTITTRDADIT